MEPLASAEQFLELKQLLKVQDAKPQTNMPLGTSWLDAPTEQGRAFVRTMPTGLAVLIDEGPYYETLYRAFDVCVLSEPADKPLVLTEIDAFGRRTSELARWEAELASHGWQLLAHNVQVEADLADSEALELRAAEQAERLVQQGIEVTLCETEEQARDVIGLWQKHLRPSDVPASHCLFLDDPAQQVLIARKNNVVCCASWWQQKAGRCEVRHVVTAPDYLHRGIASAVLAATLVQAANAACPWAYTYIDRQNDKSLGLFAKAGFEQNGRESTQYLLDACSGE